MFTDKIAKICLAAALLGLGMLVACSGDNVASTYSETQTGTPIAEWAESYIPGQIDDDSHIGLCKKQAESDVEDGDVVDDDIAADTGDVGTAVVNCVSFLAFEMKTRVQIVDSEGNPVEGAKISYDYCSDGDSRCQYVADKDGYAYMGEQMYLTVGGSKPDYSIMYESFAFRVFSSDSSLGRYGRADFSEATIVEVDGDTLVELKKIVVEPLYTVKVYLDSLYSVSDEDTLEREELCHESWTKTMWETLDGTSVDVYRTDVEDYSLYIYPKYVITEEDCKNGYVVLYALPEGTYDFLIEGTDYNVPPLKVKP